MMTRFQFLALLAIPVLAQASPSRMKIAADGEPGQRMILAGRVLGADGKPRAGVEIYAYHTDARGLYRPDNAYPEAPPRLRGTLVTAADGSYQIDTIKPTPYPNRNIPAHIHIHLRGPGYDQTEELFFEGDPLLKSDVAAAHRSDVLALRKDSDGVLRVSHDFHLKGNR